MNQSQTMQDIADVIIYTSKQQHKDFTNENAVLSIVCRNPRESAKGIAQEYNTTHSMPIGQDTVEKILTSCRLGRVKERAEVVKACAKSAVEILDAIDRKDGAAVEAAQQGISPHRQSRRLILLMLGNTWREELPDDAYPHLMRMNRDFAHGCLGSILDLRESWEETSALDYEREISRLKADLKHAQDMIARLQISGEEELRRAQAEEQSRLIRNLNAEKYGFILDTLLAAQEGFRQLRRNDGVPKEIKSAQALTRRLIEFVEDCGIEPMTEVGDTMEVCADDISGFAYDGMPFTGTTQTKQVEVVTPGWIVAETGLVISYPRVKEIDGTERE